MFRNCTSLTSAPRLSATTLAQSCYQGVFYGCTNLNSITLDYTGNFSTDYFNYWVSGVASTGTFYYNGNDRTTGVSAIPTGWTVLQIPRPELCFTAEEANSTVAMKANGHAPTVSLEYSTDGSTWSPFEVGTTTVTLANIDDKMWVRATSKGNTRMGGTTTNYNKFVMTGKIAASGNVDTLLDKNGNATLKIYCYYSLFSGCTSLTQAPDLPSTTLDDSCYSGMFQGCTSLTQAPALPAMTLADNCYQRMFNRCTSLTSAPELPATTLARSCYESMFCGCSSLTSAPELPATTLAENCYYYMFNDCRSLTSAPALPATTLAYGCYSSMFAGCTSLTTAPELPATTLANSCYRGMFSKCTSLTTAPELPATTLDNYCYNSMFQGCNNLNTIKLSYTGDFADAPTGAFGNWVSDVASTGTFYYNGTYTERGTSYIPNGWTITPFTP